MGFIGRKNELADLRKELSSPEPSLIIMYGRRRVGKSTLIQEAAKGLPFLYFQATRDIARANLAYFKAAAVQAVGDDGIIGNMPDWFSTLNHLAQMAVRLPGLIVALDEFPYLCEDDQSFPSYIQKFIDSGAPRRGNLKLLLCGSTVASMEDLLAERNPLFGRQTGIYDIGPMPLREAMGFFPHYAPQDAIAAYAVFGGIPYYLEACDPTASLEENILATLLARRGRLMDEPVNMLKSETKGSARFFGVLHAIADGCTKSGEIRSRVGAGEGKEVGWYLDRLRALRIVRADQSMDATPKERDRRYMIEDPLTAFWFRFVQPNLSAVGLGFGQDVLDSKVLPSFSSYMGSAFEEICRQHVRLWAQETMGSPARQVGKIWSGDYDIDVAGELLDGCFIFGECKWTNQLVGESVLERLVENASKVAGYGNGIRKFVLFSKTGFTEALIQQAASTSSVTLFTPAALVGINNKPRRKAKI